VLTVRVGALAPIETVARPSHMRLVVGTIEAAVAAGREVDLHPETVTWDVEEGITLVITRIALR
jgi:hypothetical protein